MDALLCFHPAVRRRPVTASFISFHRVSFSYDSQAEPLLLDCTFAATEGWTGLVGPNGCGKTTILLLASGILQPSGGVVTIPGQALYCSQRTDDPPDGLEDFLGDRGPGASETRGRLEIQGDWAARWASLSHGERKRAQIGCALWREPEILAIDEPTNHVDAETRRFLLDGLRRYRGIGLLVSHDRALLDGLCRGCLMVDPLRAPAERVTMRRGGYTDAAAAARAETDHLRAQMTDARAEARALGAEVRQRRAQAVAARARLSKRRIGRKDIDARRRADLARMTGRDRSSARLVREMETRRGRAEQAAHRVTLKKDYDVSLWFHSERTRRDTLFAVPASEIPLGGGRVLAVPDLIAEPRDRIALCGPNGSGKSTLVRFIVASLSLPADRLVIMPQELDTEASTRLARELSSLPHEQLGRALTVVNLLGSDPRRILESASLSPGEARKVLLAMGIARVPHLIVMDEPTNHLDVPSIECLGSALAECTCGLLLVSHDERFLGPLATRRWEITKGRERSILREVSLTAAPT
jgi:ATPase subunit of ABC transporter with duplicated ATPase domains